MVTRTWNLPFAPPWKSGASAPGRTVFDMGFSPCATPEGTPGAKAHVRFIRNAALKGSLFHGSQAAFFEPVQKNRQDGLELAAINFCRANCGSLRLQPELWREQCRNT